MSFGQKFILAYDGLSMPPDIREFCRRFSIGGLILFGDNYADPLQLAAATDELQAVCTSEASLFIASDHEGGRVQRFKSGFTHLPPMADVSAMQLRDAEKLFAKAAEELHACGINLNFAPVADLAPRDRAGAIGDRAFSDDPSIATQFVVTAINAYQRRGVLACAKHFPGHGSSEVDSHRALPLIIRSHGQERLELMPFEAAVRAGAAGIMTAHATYSERDDVPATFSRYWICEILREQMGFGGLVFSDALEMTAISQRWDPTEAGRLAFRAGTDVVIFYLVEEQLRAAHDLCIAADCGAFDVVATNLSLSRIDAAKSSIASGRFAT